jgi:PAS domain S-box-containing protein
MSEKKIERQKKYKIIFMSVLLALCFLLTFYFHAVFKTGVVFSHFFYVPIILSALWWRKRGIWVAVFLAGLLILFSHIFQKEDFITAGDYLRAVMFITIAFVVAFLAEERERRNRELSGLCSIYTALSSSMDLEGKIKAAVQEIFNTMPIDGICVFISEPDGSFNLRYSDGISESYYRKRWNNGESALIDTVAQGGELTIFEDINTVRGGEIGYLASKGLRSVAYIPISAKAQKVFGVIQIVSRIIKNFTTEQRNVLSLIGNRVGVTIESSILYENYKKSEEKYRTLFDADPNPIFIIDSQTFTILDLNRRAEDCYGYAREQLLGISFLDLGDGDQELEEVFKNLPEGKFILLSKKRHYRKGKQPFYVNINVSHAKYSEGYALIATTTDISETVRKDAQLIQASKMTTLGTMAAGMAHEINQPLNVLQVGADFLLKKARKGESLDSEEFKTIANEISDNVHRAAQIINHMRDFSRQSDAVSSMLNINDPIRDTFKILGQQLRVHQVELELDLNENLPPILADHNRMEQVFMNLVTNAMDALDERGVKLKDPHWRKSLKIKSFPEDDQVVVTVTDNGVGIPNEIIDKIFEPFFTTKEVGKGTGLGISISYGIVKDYGGTIEVKSGVNVGTTFELRFPPLKNDGNER